MRALRALVRDFNSYRWAGRTLIDAAGLQQVIDVYWEAEGLTTPKGAPEKYMDLSYQQRAGN